MYKKVELASNLATLIVAGLLGYVLIDHYFVHKTPIPASSSIKAGETIVLTGVNWQRNERTLVLVLQKGCRFCIESAPFYQRLVREAEQSGRVHLMAVLPQASNEAAEYLRGIGVSILDVHQAKPGLMRVHGTPTLLLVGSTGLVERVWIGKLSTEKESQVLHSL